MNFEISRVYREIIEDVTRALLSDSEVTLLQPQDIFDLKQLWSRKLREMTMPADRPPRYRDNNSMISSYPNSKPRYIDSVYDNSNDNNMKMNSNNVPNANVYVSVGSDSEEEDSDQKLEAMFPNYMMCLYSKVDKSKHKWKVKLKQGFLNVGKMEYAFDHAHGDLTW